MHGIDRGRHGKRAAPVLERQGKWIMAGSSARVALAALLLLALPAGMPARAADGDYDPAFGAGGRVAFDVGNGPSDWGQVLRALPDGRILMAGSCTTPSGQVQFCAARLRADGGYDPGFGPGGAGGVGGYVRFDAFGVPAGARLTDMIRLADGRLVLLGHDDSEVQLALLKADGSALDPAFGTVQGWTRFRFNGTASTAGKLAQQADGKLLVAGSAIGATGNVDMAILRIESGLALRDGSFGLAGVQLVAFDLGGPAGDNSDVALALALQPDGRIVLAGVANVGAFDPRGALARLLPNGERDPSFGPAGDGRVHLPANSTLRALALDRRGRLVVGGASWNGVTGAWLVNRFDADGRQDAGFNGGAALSFWRAAEDVGEIRDLVVRPGGDLLVGGHADIKPMTTRNPDSFLMAARLRANGQFDPGFGVGGRSYAGYTERPAPVAPGYANHAYTLAIGSGGLLLGGRSQPSEQDKNRFGVVRLRFDPLFSDGFDPLP